MTEEKKYVYKHPHPAITADCVLFAFDGQQLKVLLIERGGEPYKGCWAFPGGFMNIDETAEECARRELEEETGLRGVAVEQFHTFSAVQRDPRERVVSVAHYALVRQSEVRGGDDAAWAQWFELEHIPRLAFDHDRILAKALDCLRLRFGREPVAFDLLPEVFTPEQLQRLGHIVVGASFDWRQYWQRLLPSGALTAVGAQPSAAASPAEGQEYRFDARRYAEWKRSTDAERR